MTTNPLPQEVAELRKIAMGDGGVSQDPYAAVDELVDLATPNARLRAAAECAADVMGNMSINDWEVKWKRPYAGCAVDVEKELRAALLASPAPASDHTDAKLWELRPVLYHLDDGKVAAAMLVGRDPRNSWSQLVVDLMSGDGPSVVGKPEWFDEGYVADYGGLVPEAADEGTEPGQWSYGVRKLPQFLAHPASPAAPQRDDDAAVEARATEVESALADLAVAGFGQGAHPETSARYVDARAREFDAKQRLRALLRARPAAPVPVAADARLREAAVMAVEWLRYCERAVRAKVNQENTADAHRDCAARLERALEAAPPKTAEAEQGEDAKRLRVVSESLTEMLNDSKAGWHRSHACILLHQFGFVVEGLARSELSRRAREEGAK